MAYTTIKKPSDYFNTVLYTGNGSTQSITGVNFQPDFTWIKNRSADQNHSLTDIVRGATKTLRTDATTAETTDAQGQTSFDSDGFTVGSEAKINGSGNNIVAWNWLADNTSGSSNTDGSITSTVSANTTSGFSVVKYTGNGTGNSTIGHGLGATPKFIIVKCLSATQSWGTYSPSFVSASEPRVVYLNQTGSYSNDTNVWGTSAAFNNNTFTVGTWTGSNASGQTFIAYCFAEVKGFSKFGSYTGNGSADGTFVYTGFKPAFVLVKNTQNSDTLWYLFDNKRNSFNLVNTALYPNSSVVEGISGSSIMDFVSNGFKLRGSSGGTNPSGQTMIYMAFAEQPLVGDNPATAR
jgi:hypothetical protein